MSFVMVFYHHNVLFHDQFLVGFFFFPTISLWKEEIHLLVNTFKAVVEGDICLVDSDICVS